MQASGRVPVGLGLLLGALVAADLALRAARFDAVGRLVAISHEAQVGLARAVSGPARLDLAMGALHPGWEKAPLHPLLASVAGQLAGVASVDARLAAIAATWLYAASLPPLCAAVAWRVYGRGAALGAALCAAAAPAMGGDLREYGLFAALGLTALAIELGPWRPAGWGRPLGLGLVVGLLAASRWDALAWVGLWAVVRLVRARQGSGAEGPVGAFAALGLAALTFSGVQAWAYPDSDLLQRLGERLAVVSAISAAFGGQSGLTSPFSQLHDAPAGLLGPGDGPSFLQGWAAGLLGYLQQQAPVLLHPLTWPAWALAALGLSGLSPRGRLAALVVLLSPLWLSFMPPKPVYLLPAACAVGVLGGGGWRGLAGRAPAGLRLALGLVLALLALLARAAPELQPAEAARLQALHRVSASLEAHLPAGAALVAPEDLCVLRLGRSACWPSELGSRADPTRWSAWGPDQGGGAAASGAATQALGDGWVLRAPAP